MLVSSIWQGQCIATVFWYKTTKENEEEQQEATLAYHDLWLSNFPSSVRTEVLRLVAIISDREKIHLHFFSEYLFFKIIKAIELNSLK